MVLELASTRGVHRWTSHQSITGPHAVDREPFTLTHTHTSGQFRDLHWCMYFGLYGRKPEHPERTYADAGRRWKLHTERSVWSGSANHCATVSLRVCLKYQPQDAIRKSSTPWDLLHCECCADRRSRSRPAMQMESWRKPNNTRFFWKPLKGGRREARLIPCSLPCRPEEGVKS